MKDATPLARLRALANTRLATLSATLEKDRRAPTLEELQEIKLLAEIGALGPTSSAKIRRWMLGLVFVATVVAVIVLSRVRFNTTSMHVVVDTSTLSFVAAGLGRVNFPRPVHRLDITGLSRVQIPGRPDIDADVAGSVGLVLECMHPSPGCSISVETVWFNATTSLAFQRRPEALTTWIRDPTAMSMFLVSTQGPIRAAVARPPGESIQWSWAAATGIQMRSRSVDTVSFTSQGWPATADLRLASAFRVSGVSFDWKQPLPDGHTSSVSGILSGTLFLDDLAGRKYELTQSEHVESAPATGSSGWIAMDGAMTNISLTGDGISAAFTGQVQSPHVGGGQTRAVAPTWLDWLSANPFVTLAWAAVIYAMTNVAGLFQWWKAANSHV